MAIHHLIAYFFINLSSITIPNIYPLPEEIPDLFMRLWKKILPSG